MPERDSERGENAAQREIAAELERLETLLAEAARSAARIAKLVAQPTSNGRATVVKRQPSSSDRASPESKHTLPKSDSPPAKPSAEERARALSAEVSREGRALGTSSLDRAHRTARVAVWAGRARSLLDEFGSDEWRMRELVERLLRDLADLARSLDLESIEALDRRWKTDFKVYCDYQQAKLDAGELTLPAAEQADFFRALVGALLLPGRIVGAAQAKQTLDDAEQVLGSDEPLIVEARQKFAEKIERATKAATPPPEPPAPAPLRAADVLGATKGRRVLMLGGSFDNPSQLGEVQQLFKFSRFKWLTATSGSADAFERIAATVGEQYEVAFALPGADAEELRVLIDACEGAEVPVVHVSTDYSESSLATAAILHFGPPEVPAPREPKRSAPQAPRAPGRDRDDRGDRSRRRW